MQRIGMVNGSPRGEKSASYYFCQEISKMLNPTVGTVEIITALHYGDQTSRATVFEAMAQLDTLIFVFPLYIDSIPSNLLDFLTEFADFYHQRKQSGLTINALPRVYAVCNNGFIEGTQNRTALKIMEYYAQALGMQWRFGIGIGGGEFMRNTQGQIPLQSKVKNRVYQALLQLKTDIETNEVTLQKNRFVNPSISKNLFMMVGNYNWLGMAKQFRLRKRDLYAQPYRMEE